MEKLYNSSPYLIEVIHIKIRKESQENKVNCNCQQRNGHKVIVEEIREADKIIIGAIKKERCYFIRRITVSLR